MKNNMKRRLQLRFVLLSMAALLLLQGAIVSFSIHQSYRDMVKKADLILEQVHKDPTANVRYFSVSVNPGKSTVTVDSKQNVSVTPADAARYAKAALARGEDSGFAEDYRYHVYRKSGGIRLLFLSRTASIEMFRSASATLIYASLAGLGGMCVLLIAISGWVVQPLVENHRKQKTFITAASHELKTPLTVIRADAQLLQTEIGDSQWLQDILSQVDHLTHMTESLVTLARAEEYDDSASKREFSLSAAAEEVLRPYTGLAINSGKTLQAQILPDVICHGEEKAIRQLVMILLDNAFKYCPEQGSISLSVQKTLGGAMLTVTNTARNVDQDQVQMFTTRFYRGATAESTKGFGLGLSIADEIVKRHKGKLVITAPEDDRVRISAVLR